MKYRKTKRVIIAFSIVIVVLIFSALFLWRIPVYILLKSVKVPENSVEIETKIEISDVYWYHIIGDRLIKCDEGYEETIKYIEENNMDKQSDDLEFFGFFAVEDDEPVAEPDIGTVDENDYDKYVVIRYYKAL